MENKKRNSIETLSKSMVLVGVLGLLVDAFKVFVEDTSTHTAKELEEVMKKLEGN